jgi:glycosyltransferase involved in cell wall biosynthesis
MKILHIATGFKLSFPGGITNYVRSLAAVQAACGDEVHVLARPDDSATYPSGVTLKAYVPSCVAPFSLENVTRDPSTSQIVKLLQEERYDMAHFHMALDLPLHFLRDFADFRIPYTVTLNDYYFVCPRIFMVDAAANVCREIDLDKCKSCIGRLDQIQLVRRAAKKLGVPLPRIASTAAEERLTVMRGFLRNASLLLAASTRTAEIYSNAVPDAHFEIEQIGNESANMPPAMKTKSDRIRFTALGTLSKSKGAGVLEEILKRAHRTDAEFHFYGRAHEGYGRRLRRLGLIDHGAYVPEDLPAIMAKTDVGVVIPIWEDNGPQVAMEFVNNRIPVLGTRRGGIPDIVAENAGFLFEPDSGAELEQAVDWIEHIKLTELSAISSRMRPLVTPQQHALRVSELYRQALRRCA